MHLLCYWHVVDQSGEKFEYINQRYLSCLFFSGPYYVLGSFVNIKYRKGETGTKAFVNRFVNFV